MVFHDFAADLRPSFDQRIGYFLNALFIVAAPIYLFVTVFDLDLESNYLLFGLVTVISSAILTLAYHNVLYYKKARLVEARENTVTQSTVLQMEGSRKKSVVEDAKLAQLTATHNQARAEGIVLVNAIFVGVVFVLSFFAFNTSQPEFNYVLSVSLAAAVASIGTATSL
eukprot:TRINITY_DN11593_c0_g1_i1.p1 TRINITY_DN11593_c0_g1~~TRINITY_DN11593_c0_g1_i1.p1  ORF type:complete len:169 (+),score=46.13 TRINITY_DN11593_c0_g1_i1:181-687(+)